MVAIAIVGLILWFGTFCRVRAARFQARHEEFAHRATRMWCVIGDEAAKRRVAAIKQWCKRMSAKYEGAARYPFLPVWSDPLVTE